jgi:thioredoxin-related protein
MKFFTSFGLAISLILSLAIPAQAEDGPWMVDFQAALAKAKAEKKLVMVDFTGSDWCVWCKRLQAEVFDAEVFKKKAPEMFVLMVVDRPHDKSKLAAAVVSQNDKIVKQYDVFEFPKILFLDPKGNVVAKGGYRPGGAEKFVEYLADIHKTWQEILRGKTDLLKIKGEKRIKLLDQIVDGYVKLESPSEDLAVCSREIVTLDPKNKSGLKPKHEFRLAVCKCDSLIEKKEVVDAVASLRAAMKIKGLDDKQTAELDARLKKYEKSAAGLQSYVKLRPGLDKSKGIKRAKLLDQLIDAYEAVEPQFTGSLKEKPDIKAWREEVIALDDKNKAGLHHKQLVAGTIAEANSLSREGKFDPAQELLDKTLALAGLDSPQKHKLWHCKGTLFAQQNNPDKQAECWRKAIAADPKNALNESMNQELAKLGKA